MADGEASGPCRPPPPHLCRAQRPHRRPRRPASPSTTAAPPPTDSLRSRYRSRKLQSRLRLSLSSHRFTWEIPIIHTVHGLSHFVSFCAFADTIECCLRRRSAKIEGLSSPTIVGHCATDEATATSMPVSLTLSLSLWKRSKRLSSSSERATRSPRSVGLIPTAAAAPTVGNCGGKGGRESEDGREGASAPLQTGPPRQQPRSSLSVFVEKALRRRR